MSLVRLLAIGQSLDATREVTARYREPRQGLLPKFGPITSLTSSALLGRSELNRTMSSSSSSIFAAIPLKWRAGAGSAGSVREQLRERVSKCRVGARGALAGVVKVLGGLAEKLAAVRLLAKRHHVPAARSLRPPTTPVQGELSLDAVKVIRNDLSDSDLEVVPARTSETAAGKSSTAESAVWQRLTNGSWGRLTARLFQVPVGFQDESGFHLGVQSAEKEVRWPQLW